VAIWLVWLAAGLPCAVISAVAAPIASGGGYRAGSASR
jgi:hypothetical protein